MFYKIQHNDLRAKSAGSDSSDSGDRKHERQSLQKDLLSYKPTPVNAEHKKTRLIAFFYALKTLNTTNVE